MIRFLLPMTLLACGRNVTQSDYKFAGVGLNPEEIAPTPKMYGGMVSYDFIEFSENRVPPRFQGQMEALGYETDNFMTNTATIAFFMQLQLSFIVVYSILQLVQMYCVKGPRITKINDWLAQ